MSEKELELQVLLKELDHADANISGYMTVHVKSLAVVATVLDSALGLLFATAPEGCMSWSNAPLGAMASSASPHH